MTRKQKKRLKALDAKLKYSYLSYEEHEEYVELLELDCDRLANAVKWCSRISIALSITSVLATLILVFTR